MAARKPKKKSSPPKRFTKPKQQGPLSKKELAELLTPKEEQVELSTPAPVMEPAPLGFNKEVPEEEVEVSTKEDIKNDIVAAVSNSMDGLDKEPKEFNLEDEPISPSSKNSKLYIVAIVALVLVILGSIFFLFPQIKDKMSSLISKPTPTQAPTPTLTKVPEKILKREEWKFEVLNGSGVSGAAGELAKKLKDKGYTEVKTGNADTQVDTTQIFVAKSKKSDGDLVLKDIKDIVSSASISGVLDGDDVSMRIVLGKQ